MFIARERVPAAATSTASSPRGASSTSRPADLAERTVVFLDCGNIDRMPVEAFRSDDAHDRSTSTTTTTTPASATVNLVDGDASCTAEIVWDLMHGARRRAHADDRRGALRRAGHRHRQFMYENTGAARAPDGRRADRGRRRRRTRSTAASTRACPIGKLRLLARALAQRRALRRRRADAHASQRRGLRGDRRRGELHRGHRRPPARGRGHEVAALVARAAADGDGGRAEGLAALDRRRRRRLARSPASTGGGGHRRAAGFTHRAAARRARRVPARRRSPRSSEPLRGRAATAIDGVVLLSTSRPG